MENNQKIEKIDSELKDFSYVKEVSLNAKGFMQISIKYRDNEKIDNEKLAKDAKSLKSELEKQGFKVQVVEVKK